MGYNVPLEVAKAKLDAMTAENHHPDIKYEIVPNL